MKGRGLFFFLLWCIAMAFMVTTASADVVDSVRAVPWQGDPNTHHTAINGQSVKLKGVVTARPEVAGGGDPVVAAAWNTGSDNVLRVVYTGTNYVSWARAFITTGDTSDTVCLYDYGGGSCDVANLCTAGYSAIDFDTSTTLGPGATPEQIDLQSINTGCGSGGSLLLYLNGTLIQTLDTDSSDCQCSTEIQSTGSAGTSVTLWYQWNFGDGTTSAVTEITSTSPVMIEADHTYTAADGTPFTAVLMVDGVDSTMANAVSDPYLVKIEENTLDARVNIAIDDGLWYLYKNQLVNASIVSLADEPVTAWASYSNYYPSSTAVAVQAFEINNHKETGNFAEDPYAEAVSAGLNWLLNGAFGSTAALNEIQLPVSGSHGVNCDSNGNGIGVQAGYPALPAYQGGMIMDAIISAGTPDMDSGRDFDGDGSTDTYRQIIQDMVDAYAWGQADGAAGSEHATGWRYNWNQQVTDNSTNQWAAIGLIPAINTVANRAPGPDGVLNTADDIVSYWATMPDFVTEYMDRSLTYTYNSGAQYFGYTNSTSLVSGTPSVTRPSGMVQMQLAFPDTYASEERWTGPEAWYAGNFDAAFSAGQRSYYGWLSFVKAMLISNTESMSNGLNWYRGDDTTTGLAQRLVDEQDGDGSWPEGGQVSHPGAYGETFVTGWAIQMLKPALFTTAPSPCFTASPNPTYADRDIAFDPGCTDHSDSAKDITNIVLFEWDFDNDGIYDASNAGPDVQQHAFACADEDLPCTYPVVLRVTDDEGIDATYSLNIRITNPPHPPEADAGGPYLVSRCDNDLLTLDGSQSFEPNEGESEAGCVSCPGDTITAWEWDLTMPLTGFDDMSGETVVLDADYINATFAISGANTIGLRVTDNTAASYPTSEQPDLTDADFATVEVFDACPDCMVQAELGCESVSLSWSTAGQYEVYRSTQGANTGFELLATVDGTSFQDDAVVSGTTYYYRLKGADNCMTSAASIAYVFDPGLCEIGMCIDDLVAHAKSRKVELNWTCEADAQCYNVYRSLNPGVATTADNRVAECHTTAYCSYTDRSVTNGTAYYYKVTKVIGGEEICVSDEVNATPADDGGRRR